MAASYTTPKDLLLYYIVRTLHSEDEVLHFLKLVASCNNIRCCLIRASAPKITWLLFADIATVATSIKKNA